MADNYLEKRFEEYRQPEKKVVRKGGPSLDSLLLRNPMRRGGWVLSSFSTDIERKFSYRNF